MALLLFWPALPTIAPRALAHAAYISLARVISRISFFFFNVVSLFFGNGTGCLVKRIGAHTHVAQGGGGGAEIRDKIAWVLPHCTFSTYEIHLMHPFPKPKSKLRVSVDVLWRIFFLWVRVLEGVFLQHIHDAPGYFALGAFSW